MTTKWSNLDWIVRDDHEHAYPAGPNFYNPGSLWFDGSKLHLYIRQDLLGRWQCAELHTVQKFGFGTYTWTVDGTYINGKAFGVHNIHKNAVLGLFQYPDKETGPDGTHEIDIEISRWGNQPFDRMLNYSTYSTTLKSETNNLAGQDNRQESYPCLTSNSKQIHQFTRKKDSIIFELIDGNTGSTVVKQVREGLAPAQISQAEMPVYTNLWLNKGLPPDDTVEVVISKFEFKPL